MGPYFVAFYHVYGRSGLNVMETPVYEDAETTKSISIQTTASHINYLLTSHGSYSVSSPEDLKP